jgi:hypothetical protein
MRSRSRVILLCGMLIVLSAYTMEVAKPGVTPTTTDATSREYAKFVLALEMAGATVEARGDALADDSLFSVPGREFLVNHTAIVTVFAYANAASTERDTSCIKGGDKRSPDGRASVIVDYAAPPHFYIFGQVIAEYVGMDAGMLTLLAQVLGPPFDEQHWS